MDYETFGTIGTNTYTTATWTANNYANVDCAGALDNYFTYTNYQDEHMKECVREEVRRLMARYVQRICDTVKEYAKLDIPEEEFMNILMGE